MHPGKASSGRSESHIQLSCWQKGFSGNLNITRADANIKGRSLKTYNGTPLSRSPTTQLIDHGEVELVYSGSFYSSFLFFLVQEVALQDTEKET